MAFPDHLIKKAAADYDINKIGFILIDENSDDNMDIDFELTPTIPKQKKRPICYLCGRDFTNVSNLRRHLNTLHLERKQKFKCFKCEEVFTDKRTLNNHQRCSHREAQSVFICDFCGTEKPSSSALVEHFEIHQKLDIDIDDIF